MTQKTIPPCHDLLARLGQLGDLRVWSVIITIFGDAVMPRGGTVPASVLSAITDRLSIKPEALRVALYRLAKDGWITRAKSGRNSFYRLSDSGHAEFLSATRRIYATGPELRGPWQLAGLPPMPEARRNKAAAQMRAAGFLPLSPLLFLGAAQAAPLPQQAIAVTGPLPALPDWARAALAPPALQRDYSRLAKTLDFCGARIGEITDPLDAVALRMLLIHQWRRLLLRHADLPPDLMPTGWRGEACRAQVLALHAALSPLADPWLDSALGQSQGAKYTQ